MQGPGLEQGGVKPLGSPCSAAGSRGRSDAQVKPGTLTPTLSGGGRGGSGTLLTRWLAFSCAGKRRNPESDLSHAPGPSACASAPPVLSRAAASYGPPRGSPGVAPALSEVPGCGLMGQPEGGTAGYSCAERPLVPVLAAPDRMLAAAPDQAPEVLPPDMAETASPPNQAPTAVRELARALAQAPAAARASGLARAAVVADEGRPRRAACGVRVMWVSAGARRQGVASRLMDAARHARAVWAHLCMLGKTRAWEATYSSPCSSCWIR